MTAAMAKVALLQLLFAAGLLCNNVLAFNINNIARQLQHGALQQNFASATTSSLSTNSLMMSAGKALIVQNKGGGHGELGYHLANALTAKDIEVVLLQDGAGKNKAKEPFASYGDLEAKGVKIVWANFEEGVGKFIPEGETFDYVFDNFAKDVDTAKDVVEAAKGWGVKHYVYVSSGGMYKDSDELPLLETSPVKETGQRLVEKYAEEMKLPWTAFRPQYIYGPKTNKRDYLDFFFDRVVYDVWPFCLPLHGDQFASCTHAADVADMMAAVVGNTKAVGEVFNCATDRYVTYNELAKKVSQVVGKEIKQFNYFEPSDFNIKKGWFPFRNNHFFVNPEKAKRLLGWKPKHNVLEDLPAYYEGFKAAGRDKRQAEVDFSVDDSINIVHPEFVPWMMKQALAVEVPDAFEQVENISKTVDPIEQFYYSGIMERAKIGYAEMSEEDKRAHLESYYQGGEMPEEEKEWFKQ